MSVPIPQHVIVFLFAITSGYKPMTLMTQALDHVSFSHPLLQRFHKRFSRHRRYSMVKLLVVPGTKKKTPFFNLIHNYFKCVKIIPSLTNKHYFLIVTTFLDYNYHNTLLLNALYSAPI